MKKKKSSNLISLTIEKENEKKDLFEIPVNLAEINSTSKPVQIPVVNHSARSATELRKNAWINSGYTEKFPRELDLEKAFHLNNSILFNRHRRLVFDNFTRKDFFF